MRFLKHPHPPTRRGRAAASAAVVLLLMACSGDKGSQPPTAALTPEFSGGGCTGVYATRYQSSPIHVANNSTDNEAIWFYHNDTGSDISVSAINCSRGGHVTSCTPLNSETTLLTGMTDFETGFSGGTVGTGTVGMSITLPCGTVIAPTYPVSVD